MHSKKHLSFSAIRKMISDNLETIKDRRAANNSNSIVDGAIPNMAYTPVIKLFNIRSIQKYT
jgi:hypothetical protein